MEKRYKYLDGLKGFSAIGVSFYHYILAFASFGFIGWGSAIAPEAQTSVYWENFPYSIVSNTSFIYISLTIISLLPTLYFFEAKKTDWIKKEATIRYFRFMPSLLICSIISWAIYANGLYFNKEVAQLANSNWSSCFYTTKLSFWGALESGFYKVLFCNGQEYNSVFWVMTKIFIGSYLSYFVIVFFCPLKRRYLAYIALMLLCIIEPIFSWFLTGIILGDIISNTKKRKEISILLIILGFIICNFPRVWLPIYLSRDFLLALSAFCIILGSAWSDWANKILDSRVLRYFGKNSFSLILIHFPIMYSFSAYVFLKAQANFGYEIALAITFITAIPANWLGTEIFSRIIRKPTQIICAKIYAYIK